MLSKYLPWSVISYFNLPVEDTAALAALGKYQYEKYQRDHDGTLLTRCYINLYFAIVGEIQDPDTLCLYVEIHKMRYLSSLLSLSYQRQGHVHYPESQRAKLAMEQQFSLFKKPGPFKIIDGIQHTLYETNDCGHITQTVKRTKATEHPFDSRIQDYKKMLEYLIKAQSYMKPTEHYVYATNIAYQIKNFESKLASLEEDRIKYYQMAAEEYDRAIETRNQRQIEAREDFKRSCKEREITCKIEGSIRTMQQTEAKQDALRSIANSARSIAQDVSAMRYTP